MNDANNGAMKGTNARLQLSVQAFFGECNWHGQTAAIIQNGHQADPTSRFNLLVGDFFRLLPWEGMPEVGSVPKAPPPSPAMRNAQPEEEDATLDELFDTF